MENTSWNGKSGVRIAWLGIEDLVSVFILAQIEIIPAVLGIVRWPAINFASVNVSHCNIPHFFTSRSFSASTLPSPENTKLSNLSVSLHAMIMVNTEYSIHQVQPTPSTAYTMYSIHQVQHTPSAAYTKCSIHQVQLDPAIDCLPLPASLSFLIPHLLAAHVAFSSLHSYDYELTNDQSSCTCPASVLMYHLQIGHPAVCLHYCSITTTKCISQFTWSRPPTVSPNSPDHSLQVCTIVALKCISNSFDHSLKAHVRVHSIFTSKWISKLAWSQLQSVSLSWQHPSPKLHLEIHWIGISRCSSDCGIVVIVAKLTIYIYRERPRYWICMIIWCHESCHSHRDKYDSRRWYTNSIDKYNRQVW